MRLLCHTNGNCQLTNGSLCVLYFMPLILKAPERSNVCFRRLMCTKSVRSGSKRLLEVLGRWPLCPERENAAVRQTERPLSLTSPEPMRNRTVTAYISAAKVAGSNSWRWDYDAINRHGERNEWLMTKWAPVGIRATWPDCGCCYLDCCCCKAWVDLVCCCKLSSLVSLFL